MPQASILDPDTGAIATLPPDGVMADLSADNRWITFTELVIEGDVWMIEPVQGAVEAGEGLR